MAVNLTALQAFIYRGTAELDLPPSVDRVAQAIKSKSDVVMLGDSAVHWSAVSEDLDSVFGLLQRQCGNRIISRLSMNSADMSLMDAQVRFMLRRRYKPRLIVLCVNPRLFTSEYPYEMDTLTRTWFKYDSFLFRIFYRPLAVWKAIDLPSETPANVEAARMARQKRWVGPDSSYAYPTEFLRRAFAARYARLVAPSHPQLRFLRDLASRAKDNKIPLLAYITPVDVERGAELLGPKFRADLRTKIAVVKSELSPLSMEVLDFSEIMPHDRFAGNGPPTEHLLLPGRQQLADRLAPSILNMLER